MPSMFLELMHFLPQEVWFRVNCCFVIELLNKYVLNALWMQEVQIRLDGLSRGDVC